MARKSRRNKSNSAPAILGGIAAIAAVAVGFFLFKGNDQPSAKRFPLETYVESCNSLRGNEYSISGEILENVHHDPTVGKFIFLTVNTGDSPVSDETPKNIGILVPSDIDGPNLETKQSYTFVVDVKKEGNLVATSYTAE